VGEVETIWKPSETRREEIAYVPDLTRTTRSLDLYGEPKQIFSTECSHLRGRESPVIDDFDKALAASDFMDLNFVTLATGNFLVVEYDVPAKDCPMDERGEDHADNGGDVTFFFVGPRWVVTHRMPVFYKYFPRRK